MTPVTAGPLRILLAAVAIFAALGSATASAQMERVLRFSFVPTERAQIAVWIEDAEGNFYSTVALTSAVATRGIGNRPGALQMNSGFRWPYGRREGVLPIWGHARAAAPGAGQFRRVIFQDRSSEGAASRTTSDHSRDDYFCLSFNRSTTEQDALDAVSCASVFNSDKGRYITETDVLGGYAEPFAVDMSMTMRELSEFSVYPPRRDITRCTSPGCFDHADVEVFASDAVAAMPNLDAVSMATPAGMSPTQIQYSVPEAWPDGDYFAFFEVNVEGDHNDVYNETTYPTPVDPGAMWDHWAETYGYPYRGQPSVVYRVPFALNRTGGTFSTDEAFGYGALQGEDGMIRSMDGNIDTTPGTGSGADRLMLNVDSQRAVVDVVPVNICGGPNPPPECGVECEAAADCADGFVCSDNECVGMCDIAMPPGQIASFIAEPFPDEKNSHHFARLTFTVPSVPRPLSRYEVRVSTSPIVDADSFGRASPANAADLDTLALSVPIDGASGDSVTVDIGQLTAQTVHYFGIRAVDVCNSAGEIATTSVETTEIHFTTVTPCFVASATYGSPLAGEVSTLRRFRDRHLMTNAAGRFLVETYYRLGPTPARWVRENAALRSMSRAFLGPVIDFASWLND